MKYTFSPKSRIVGFVCAVGFLSCSHVILPANGSQDGSPQRFNVGDMVEVFSAGDAQHGVIVGEYQDTDLGYGTYQVHLDGEKYCNNHVLDTRYNSKFVVPRFQPNSTTKFNMGQSVEVRRYDGSTYKGQVLGISGEKYQVRYTHQGATSTDWFYINNVRITASLTKVTKNTPAKAPKNPAANTHKPGQKFKIGDRVLYHEIGFLTAPQYGTIIAIDAQKRLYTVRDEKDPSSAYSYAYYSVIAPDSRPGTNFFIGKWDVRIIGAVSTITRDGDLYRQYSKGMKLPPLEIKADGTYIWRDLGGKMVRGRWQARNGIPGITLLKGLDGRDYTLYEKTEAFATTRNTRDQIGLHHLPSSTGYYEAYRIGPNQSSILTGRFK